MTEIITFIQVVLIHLVGMVTLMVIAEIIITLMEALIFACFAQYLFFGYRFDSIIFNLAYLPIDIGWWFFYRLGKGSTITRLTVNGVEYAPPFWISKVKVDDSSTQ